MLALLTAICSFSASAADDPGSDVEAEYYEQKLSVKRYVAAGSGMPLRSQFFLGEELIAGPDMYEILGRPDYAEKFRRRSTVNVTLAAVGAGSLVGGFALAAARAGDLRSIGVGSGMVIAGVLCFTIPTFHRSDPGKWDEVNTLIAGYNIDLAQRLGVPLTVSAP